MSEAASAFPVFLEDTDMTTLYLIRHGEAEGNIYRRAQGQHEGRISAKGLRQVDALAERFRDVHVDALYSSDLKRTIRTAKAITMYHDAPLPGHSAGKRCGTICGSTTRTLPPA